MDTTTLAPHDLLWCVRRLPRPVVALCKAHPGSVFIAGGYVRSRVASEPVNDIDLFVRNADDARALALDLAGGDSPEAASRLHVTNNAITVKGTRPSVQLIHRWTFDTPADALASFDFTIACAALWWDGERWASACHRNYYADLAGRRLIYTSPSRNEDAGGSILRVLKFYQRGYRIPIDSLGAVVARLIGGIEMDRLPVHRFDGDREKALAFVITGLLREVDPAIDPDHVAHLPSEFQPNEDEG